MTTPILYFFGWITETNDENTESPKISISGRTPKTPSEALEQFYQPSTPKGILRFLKGAMPDEEYSDYVAKGKLLSNLYPIPKTEIAGAPHHIYPPGFKNRLSTAGFNSVYMFEENNFCAQTCQVIYENLHHSCCNIDMSGSISAMKNLADRVVPPFGDDQEPSTVGYEFSCQKVQPWSHIIPTELTCEGYWEVLLASDQTFNEQHDDETKTITYEGYYPVAKARWILTPE